MFIQIHSLILLSTSLPNAEGAYFAKLGPSIDTVWSAGSKKVVMRASFAKSRFVSNSSRKSASIMLSKTLSNSIVLPRAS